MANAYLKEKSYIFSHNITSYAFYFFSKTPFIYIHTYTSMCLYVCCLNLWATQPTIELWNWNDFVKSIIKTWRAAKRWWIHKNCECVNVATWKVKAGRITVTAFNQRNWKIMKIIKIYYSGTLLTINLRRKTIHNNTTTANATFAATKMKRANE